MAVKGSASHSAVLDYAMSEKFGLDWKEYDYQRMLDLILVESIIQKKTITKNPANG